MNSILAIDPGTRTTGYAIFDNSLLAACGCWTADGLYEMLAEIMLASVRMTLPHEILPELKTVVERPQVYGQRKWKGDPNDLIGVALVAGAAAVLFPAANFVLPHAWKQSAPKDVIQKRVREALSAAELKLVAEAKKHDIWDAVGLGLWYIRRLPKSSRRAVSTA